MAASDAGNKPLANEQLNRHNDLKKTRDARFMDDWQSISQYFLPQESDINVSKTEGISGWTDQIYDTTAIQATQTLASGMYNMFTPPNQPWAEYDAPEEVKANEGNGSDDSTQWLGKAGDRVMKELGRSNFYPTKGTADLGLGTFATDLVIFDESEGGPQLFNFIPCKIGTYTIEEDYRGLVDTARREVKMTWRQIEQKFGRDGDHIPEKMRDAVKGDTKKNKEFTLLHCIFPREDSKRIKGAKTGENKPIASVYVSIEFRECMRISGYDESPILCRRFAKWGTGAVWGYGPSYLAIPDARQVNYVQQYLDALAELHAYPRVLIPDNLEGDVDLRAGGATTWDTSNPTGKPEEWASVGDYKLGLEMQEQRRQAIRDAFFTDAFKLLNSQPLIDKEMTAYEVSQRQAEQLQGIAPAFTRTIIEFINPLMQRAFGIMYRNGKLGQAPESLMVASGAGKRALVAPEIVVTSRFNSALKALKNRGTEEWIKFIMPISEQKPEAWDVVNLDKTLIDYGRNTGTAPDNIRKDKEIAAIRQQRAKLQAQQRAAAQAEQLAKAGKNLGGAPDWMQGMAKDGIENAAA